MGYSLVKGTDGSLRVIKISTPKSVPCPNKTGSKPELASGMAGIPGLSPLFKQDSSGTVILNKEKNPANPAILDTKDDNITFLDQSNQLKYPKIPGNLPADLLQIWNVAGRPDIILGVGETCRDLQKLLSWRLNDRHHSAVTEWYQKHKPMVSAKLAEDGIMATRIFELVGNTSEAYGAHHGDTGKVYTFRYKVADLYTLIPSHTDTLTPNPNYPLELQPRLRDRAASKAQIDGIAQNLNPKVLLTDSGFLDTGPMIVGEDNVVESGNGRILALRKAVYEGLNGYQFYKNMLIDNSEKYGIPHAALGKIKNPVLVRERITSVNRAEFAREANRSAVMGLSPFEQALLDGKLLSNNIINTMQVGEEQTIDQALKSKDNNHIINHFLQMIPLNERATLSDGFGGINQQGIQRLQMAIFAKTYPDEAGQRLTRAFSESADPLIKNLENGMFQSLTDMAKAEALISTGKRDCALSISKDLAEVIDTIANLKQAGIKTPDYLKQSHMFGDELSPFQMQILEHLDAIGQRPKLIREFLRASADKIVNAPSRGQSGMFEGSEAPNKEELINGIINRQRNEIGKDPVPTAIKTKPGISKTKKASGLTFTDEKVKL